MPRARPTSGSSALAPLGTDANKPFLETAPALIAIFLKKVTIDEDGSKHKNYYTPESVGIATGVSDYGSASGGVGYLDPHT